MTPAERRTTLRTVVVNQLIGGGIVCSTEPLDKIDADRLAELRRILPPMDTHVKPIALMEGGRFPDRVLVTYPGDSRALIAVINWSDTEPCPARITLDAASLGDAFDPGARYAVSAYYAGQYRTDARAGDTLTLGEIPPHGAEVIKAEPIADAPVILASDAHYSMGLELARGDAARYDVFGPRRRTALCL